MRAHESGHYWPGLGRIAAGRGGTADEDRLALLADNVFIARQIAEALRGYEGLVVVVTNPVDVLTQVVTEHSGLPAERVLGTGTLLDCAFRDSRSVLTVSRMHADIAGAGPVALSLPTVVGRAGGIQPVHPDMDAWEREALANSAQVLQQAYRDATGAERPQ